jgi:hypothetical protein
MITPQEEYLARHGLDDVAVIQHVKNGSVFVYSEGVWTILSIKWQDNPIHPGEYHFSYLTPIHNGYKEHLFERDDYILQYDEYEDFIYQWSSKNGWGAKARAIEGEWQSILTCWEMFLIMFDGWFVENASFTLKRLLFESVDPDSDLFCRLRYYKESIFILAEKHPSVLKRFKVDVLTYAHSYCNWLARLLNRS